MRRNIGIRNYPPRNQTKRERFEWHGWERIKDSGCWEWLGGTNEHGTGIFTEPGTRKTETAHRVSYEFFVGQIVPGQVIVRDCENNLCINPEHLSVRGDDSIKSETRAELKARTAKAERLSDMWRARAMDTNRENNKLLEKLEEAHDQIRDLTARLEEVLSLR